MKGCTFLLAIGSILIGITSCSKENSSSYGSMSALVNGSLFKSTTVGHANPQPNDSQYLYEFAAVDANATLDFYLPAVTIGTYPFGIANNSPSIMYFSGTNYYSTISPSNMPTAGSIIIDSAGKNSITGTFSGVLYNQNLLTDSVVITNGTFTNCTY